jgi:hypothetical protein
LNWKPAPTALSALEIVNHLAEGLDKMRSVLTGGAYASDIAPATDRESAEAVLRQQSELYAQTLSAITPNELGETIMLPWGDTPKALAASMEVIDLITITARSLTSSRCSATPKCTSNSWATKFL